MDSNIDGLLDCIKEINHYYVNESSEFNIFKILSLEHREIYFCRFIGALLDPAGLHGAGSLPLELFFKYVLGINKFRPELSRVELEELTQNGRRVDIVIYNGPNVYPIEVKIGARDGELQLSDYYNNYFKNKEGKIYYLTPTGHEPSGTSIGDMDMSFIRCISFGDLSRWLDALCSYEDFAQKDICRQFCMFVNDIKERYNMPDEVMKKIFEANNTENIAAAIAVIEEKDNILKKIEEDFLYKLKQIIESIEYTDENKNGRYICDYENDLSIDKYRRLRINKADTNKDGGLCYICIEDNLYMTLGDLAEKNTSWVESAWVYVLVDGQRFNLKYPKYNVIKFTYGEDNDIEEKMKKALENLLNSVSYSENDNENSIE